MKSKKTVWIPAIIAAVAAALLVAYYYYTRASDAGIRHLPAGSMRRHPGGEGSQGDGEIFKNLATVALFLAAASFSWFWFRKKLKSPSMLVRKAGELINSVHRLLGWAVLILIAVHGTYFLITKLDDNKIYTGLAGFAILLTISGYGYLINKVRNKWMRTVHRSLGLILVPLLLLHAGGSAVIAVIASLAVGGLIWILERKVKHAVK